MQTNIRALCKKVVRPPGRLVTHSQALPTVGEPGNETTLYLVQLHELLMHIPPVAEGGT